MTANRPNALRKSLMKGHGDSVYALCSGHKGMFSSGGDGHLVHWTGKMDSNGEPEGELIARFSGSVYAVSAVSDNMMLAAQNNLGIYRIRLVDRSADLLPLGPTAIYDIAVSPQGLAFVATGSGEVVVINLGDWSIYGRIKVSDAALRTIALHPDRPELAVGSSDHHIRVFRLSDGLGGLPDEQPIQSWKAHSNSVFTLSYHPAGSHLYSAGRDARIRRWRAENGYKPDAEINAHLFAIHQLSFSPDGKHFLTCSMDKTIKLWSADEPRLLRVIDRSRHGGHSSSVNRVIWLDNLQFASAGDDRMVMLWELSGAPVNN